MLNKPIWRFIVKIFNYKSPNGFVWQFFNVQLSFVILHHFNLKSYHIHYSPCLVKFNGSVEGIKYGAEINSHMVCGSFQVIFIRHFVIWKRQKIVFSGGNYSNDSPTLPQQKSDAAQSAKGQDTFWFLSNYYSHG